MTSPCIPAIRATALQHGLTAFVFDVVIIAVTVNLVAGLGTEPEDHGRPRHLPDAARGEHPERMRIVLVGPPGSGKGTQAAILAEQLGIPAISTGELFRAHIDDGTELGRQAAVFAEAGDLVPDDITVAMVAERLGRPDCRGGYLLDGFPRTIAQAEHLRDELARRGKGLDAVLELTVDDEELIRRMSTRRVLVDGVWSVREDDRPETVRHRLRVYREATAPLVDFYTAEKLLVCIDASGDVADVAARALAALGRSPQRTG